MVINLIIKQKYKIMIFNATPLNLSNLIRIIRRV